MQNDRQWRFAVRMNCRPSDRPPAGADRRRISHAELHQREAHFRPRSYVDGSGAPNATVTGYGNARRPLPEEPPALEAEDAAPDAIEVDRNDRHVEPVDDALEAALERQHVAGPADRALGEDADDVAGLELLARRARATPTASRPAGDRNRVHQLQQPVQRRVLVVRA